MSVPSQAVSTQGQPTGGQAGSAEATGNCTFWRSVEGLVVRWMVYDLLQCTLGMQSELVGGSLGGVVTTSLHVTVPPPPLPPMVLVWGVSACCCFWGDALLTATQLVQERGWRKDEHCHYRKFYLADSSKANSVLLVLQRSALHPKRIKSNYVRHAQHQTYVKCNNCQYMWKQTQNQTMLQYNSSTKDMLSITRQRTGTVLHTTQLSRLHIADCNHSRVESIGKEMSFILNAIWIHVRLQHCIHVSDCTV